MDDKLPDLRRMKTYDRTKDIGIHPYFLGGISRWFWRLYMYRVTSAGRWYLGLSLILIVYGTSSLDLQIFVPLLYAFGVWVFAWILSIFLPPKVTLNVTYPDRIAVGSHGRVDVTVSSRSRWPLIELFIVPMRLSPYVEMTAKTKKPIMELRQGDSDVVSFNIWCRKRGIYILKGFRAESSFPLGLLNSYSGHFDRSVLTVYPKFQSLVHIDLPAGLRYQPGGVALASNLGDSLEYIGNREYREGDNIRDIDWRATARLIRPIVREYREEYFHRAGVILDTLVPRHDEARDADFERAVSVAAAVSDYMAREEYIVDLFAAGPMLYHLTAGRNLAFQDQILDILACLETVTVEPFRVIEPDLVETLSRLSTVVCVFLDWNAARQEFVDRIREISAVKVVIVRDASCTIDPTQFASELSLRVVDRASWMNGVAEL